jgi:hypothetical protein
MMGGCRYRKYMYDINVMLLTNHTHVMIIIVYHSLGIKLYSRTSPYKTTTIKRYFPVSGIY